MDKLASVGVKYFETIVISKQDKGEAISAESRDFKDFKVKRIGTTSLVMPSYLVRDSFLSSVNHVEKFIVVYTHKHLVCSKFYSSRDVTILKIDFGEYHLKFKNMLDQVSLYLCKV